MTDMMPDRLAAGDGPDGIALLSAADEVVRQGEALAESLSQHPDSRPALVGTLARRIKRFQRTATLLVSDRADDLCDHWEDVIQSLPRADREDELSLFSRTEGWAGSILTAVSAVERFVGNCARQPALDVPEARQALPDITAKLTRIKRLSAAAIRARTEPFVPLDPERYAAAVSPDNDGPWVSAKDAIARFRGTAG